MEDARISIEGIKSVADLVDKGMKAQKTYTYAEFWKLFVIPSDLKVKGEDISHLNTSDRGTIKKGINEEFMARNIPKVLFSRKGIGLYLLDKDSGVAATKLLERANKVKNSTDALVDQCSGLANGNDLDERDAKMLRNCAGRVDDFKSALAGTFGRMRSLPNPVRFELMRIFGVSLEEEEEK